MIFTLGAGDAEMRRIEEILNTVPLTSVRYAWSDGRRVHPGNAYKADPVDNIGYEPETLVFVECASNPIALMEPYEAPIIIDHHRPGDPGYDLPASDYWSASSLGQIYALLGIDEVPHEDLVLAAMDHAPAAAIRGECPGVSAQGVLERKITEIAAQTRQSEEEVRACIDNFLAFLAGASASVHIGDMEVIDCRSVEIADGYSMPFVGMQTAALAGGYTVLLRHRDRTGEAEKITIAGHTSPESVEAFMQEWAPMQGLTGIYGVPSRGYAGGYIQQ